MPCNQLTAFRAGLPIVISPSGNVMCGSLYVIVLGLTAAMNWTAFTVPFSSSTRVPLARVATPVPDLQLLEQPDERG